MQSVSLRKLHAVILLLSIFLITEHRAVSQPQRMENQIEQEKLAFEKETEVRKIYLEIFKAILTATSIALPLIIGLYSIHKQIKTAFVLKEVEARNSFELKAAELLLNSKTPGQLHAKARALMKLFPTAPLPPNFADSVESFKPDEFTGPSIEWKVELFKILVAHPDQKEGAIKLWKQLFPADKWIDNLAESSRSPLKSDSGGG